MSYQVYFADLAEENRALVLTLLKLKEEAGELEPDEAELLYKLRGSSTPTPYPPMEEPPRQRPGGGSSGGGGGGPRRPARRPNGRSQHTDN